MPVSPLCTMLPASAVARKSSLIPSKVPAAGVREWLERLKPGWAARFFPAFERAGIVELRSAAVLNDSQRAALDVELRKQGARMVQMKQLKKAMDMLSNAERTPVGTPTVHMCAKALQSPMAAYFGDSPSNLNNILNAELPRTPTAKLSSNMPSFHSKSPLGADAISTCKSPSSTICSDSDDDVEEIQTSIEHRLPYKSPMAAFFDGDGFHDFHLPSSMDSDSSESPGESDPAALSGKATPSPSLSIPTTFPPGNFEKQQTVTRSAIRRTTLSKNVRVSWAADVLEKAPLSLVELLDAPTARVSPVAQRVWVLSCDPQGTFEVQRAFDECSDDEQRMALATELRGHVVEATQCPHANHVLRKVINSMPPPALNFVILELLGQGSWGIIEAARHRYGCRIIEGLLTRCPKEQLRYLIEYLLADAASLCTHMYGNFVMQRLLEYSAPNDRSRLLKVVHVNLHVMGVNFYGSAVVGKALVYGTDEDRQKLARAIIGTHGLLAAMVRYRHGKGIVDTICATVRGDEWGAVQVQLSAMPLKMPKNPTRKTATRSP